MTREEAEALIKDLPPLEDPVIKWKREVNEDEARFEAAREARRRQEARERRAADRSADDARLLELIDQRIEWHLDALTKAIAQAEFEIRSALRNELRREFKEQLAEVRGEMKGRFSALDEMIQMRRARPSTGAWAALSAGRGVSCSAAPRPVRLPFPQIGALPGLAETGPGCAGTLRPVFRGGQNRKSDRDAPEGG